MIIIIAEEGKKLKLGRIGENEARAVRFDISRIQAEFPGATFSVLNMRPEDPDAYPVNSQYISVDGNYLYWTLQSGDLTQDALGECELKATLNGVIVKSIIWTTEICPALDGNGTPPEPWESWQQQVENDAHRAEAAAELLEHPGAVAETLPAGSQATASYDEGVFTFGIPQGDPGAQGPEGPEGPEGPQGPEGQPGQDGKDGKDGQDGATGATPIISIGTVSTLPAGSSATASMDTTDPAHPVLSMGIPQGDPGEVTEAELKSAIDGKADLICDTVQNVAIASIPDGASNLPLTALKFRVEPIQAGSGDPSPQNKRTISGRTSAVVSQSKVNVWDEQWELGAYDTTTGEKTASNSYVRCKNPIPVKPSTGYFWNTNNNNGRVFYYDETGAYIGYESISANAVNITPSKAHYATFRMASTYGTTYNDDISINYPSTDTAYHAYTGAKHTVQFESTVYGGYIDWVNGVMVVDHALDTMTGNNVVSVGTASSGINYARMSELSSRGVTTTAANKDQLKSNLYVASKDATVNNSIRINANTTPYAYNNDLDTLEKAQTFYNANPLQIWFPLYTPITVPLSNLEEIKTAQTAGVNNVWTDSGDIVELTYPCDTKQYVERRLSASQTLMELIVTANREDGMKASKAYSSGNLIIVNGTLYKATTSIANGATLTVGTNVTATTVAAELAALA